MAVLAVTVVIPVNAAKKTNKKQIQVLNLYQDQKTDIEEAEYLVSYLEDKNIDEVMSMFIGQYFYNKEYPKIHLYIFVFLDDITKL